MGMYTELCFNVRLKKQTPENVINILKNMCGNNQVEFELPKHELFKTKRWDCMLRSDSYYFNADTNSTLRFDKMAKQYYLNILCNFKNYDHELSNFLSWIMHYVDANNGEFLGYSRIEDKEPELIYKLH